MLKTRQEQRQKPKSLSRPQEVQERISLCLCVCVCVCGDEEWVEETNGFSRKNEKNGQNVTVINDPLSQRLEEKEVRRGFEDRKCRIDDRRRLASGEEDPQSPVLANLIAPLNWGTMIQTFASFFFAYSEPYSSSRQFQILL